MVRGIRTRWRSNDQRLYTEPTRLAAASLGVIRDVAKSRPHRFNSKSLMFNGLKSCGWVSGTEFGTGCLPPRDAEVGRGV
jgi:hypothetical protein